MTRIYLEAGPSQYVEVAAGGRDEQWVTCKKVGSGKQGSTKNASRICAPNESFTDRATHWSASQFC